MIDQDRVDNQELISVFTSRATAARLLDQYGTLTELARASVDELMQLRGIGPAKATALKSAFTLAQRLTKECYAERPVLDTPESVAGLLREENRLYRVENLQVVLLDTRRRLIAAQSISQGTLDTLLAHPREVFALAIAKRASALIILHNHPSGDPSPSQADIRITRDLMRAGQLLKIEVLDHIILGKATPDRPKDYVSMKELGFFAGS